MKRWLYILLALVLLACGGCDQAETDANISSDTTSLASNTSEEGADLLPDGLDGDPTTSITMISPEGNLGATSEITAQYMEDLRQVKPRERQVAAYVNDEAIYKDHVLLSLAQLDYTLACNLPSIAEDEKEAYLQRYEKDDDSMLQLLIDRKVGELEAQSVGIMVDEETLKADAEEQWQMALKSGAMLKELEALGITADEYFILYQYPVYLQNAYFNQLFEQLLPAEDFVDAQGRLDTERRDDAIVQKLQEFRKKYNIRIVE